MTDVTNNQNAFTTHLGSTLNRGRPWAVVLSLLLLATGAGLMWWLMKPSYSVLTRVNQMGELAIFARALQNLEIKYQYNSSTGELSVPTTHIHQARLALAAKGLFAATSYANRQAVARNGNSSLLQQQDGSRLPQENLEQELATTIASIDPVQSARVHLALTDTSKDGDLSRSRASVVVRMYPGRRLSSGQINAISHLVASSTYGLSLSHIAIVDQTGRLLKSAGASDVNPLTTSQFDYRQQLEQDYVERIQKILKPIVGDDKIRCQVTAVMNFDNPETVNVDDAEAPLPGKLRRLSVTVLVDDKPVNAAGGLRRVSRTQKELERIGVLIKEAIGYQAERGDKVNVINESFNIAPVVNSSSEHEFFSAWSAMTSQNRFMIGAGVLLLVLAIVALKRSGMSRTSNSNAVSSEMQQAPVTSTTGRNLNTEPENVVSETSTASCPEDKPLFEQKMHEVRELVFHDPRRVAQVLKQWVKEG